MMLCLQQFCSVLSNMEEQLSEDQAAVYSVLSDQDRCILGLPDMYRLQLPLSVSILWLNHSDTIYNVHEVSITGIRAGQ